MQNAGFLSADVGGHLDAKVCLRVKMSIWFREPNTIVVFIVAVDKMGSSFRKKKKNLLELLVYLEKKVHFASQF